MPTLCIPRRKSILIETIHHSRRPMDELLFLRLRRGSPGLCRAALGIQNPGVDRSGAIASSSSSSLCRPGFLRDSILPDFAEFRSENGRFWFISSLSARTVLRFLFWRARGIIRQLSRNSKPAQRGLSTLDDIAFRLCLWNLWSVANFD